MTPKQAAFVREYMIDRNATQAAIRAGYSAKTAEVQGCRLLSVVKVRNEIAKLEAKHAERSDMSEKFVLEGLKKIAEDTAAPHAARVTAYTNIGKHFGMFVERTENKNFNADVSSEPMDQDEWVKRHKPVH